MKHEAYAVRKSTARACWSDDGLATRADPRGSADDRAERFEQLRVGAEAMAGLKPQEIRCLLLKAEGLSYQEICEVTGFSYTKVNRSITEGRRAFLKRVAGIESGAECERLAPLISKMADGEASADELRAVRPHLKGCLACKATLREYRETPSRLAGLVPPVVALAGGGGGAGFLGRTIAALHERFGGVADTAGAKAAAIAASAVVLAGGGVAGVDAFHHDAPAVAPSVYASAAHAQAATTAAPVAGGSTAEVSASGPPDPSSAAIAAVDATSSPGLAGAEPATKAATSAPEFDPGAAGETGSGSDADPRPAEFASAPAAPIPAPSASPDAGSGTARAGSGTASADSGTASRGRGTASGEFGP